MNQITFKDLQEFSYKTFNSVVSLGSAPSTTYKIRPRPYILDPSCFSALEYKTVIDTLDQLVLLPKNLSKTFYAQWEDFTEAYEFVQHLHYCVPDFLPNQSDYYELFNNLKVIPVQSRDEFLTKVLELAKTDGALTNYEVDFLSRYLKEIPVEHLDVIKNRDLRVALLTTTDYPAKDSDELMRTICYIAETPFIKNPEAYTAITTRANDERIADVLHNYIAANGIKSLAQSFNRHKTFYMALRSKPALRSLINRISKLSKTAHIPLEEPNYLKLTRMDYSQEFDRIVKSLTVARLVKAYNAIKFASISKVGMYTIRNGKLFIKPKIPTSANMHKLAALKSIIEAKLSANIVKYNVSIKYSDLITLAVPTTSKQFSGNFPWYSSIAMKSGIVGIYWENLKNKSVDLDLSASSISQKIGWDSDSSNSSISFSGDIVDAPNGAVEAIKVSYSKDVVLLQVNDYRDAAQPIPYKLIITNKLVNDEKSNLQMVHPDNIVAQLPQVLQTRQEAIGCIADNRFYFGNYQMPAKASATIPAEDLMYGLEAMATTKLTFEDLDLPAITNGTILDSENPDKGLLLKLIS